jgi:hypothetical protein
LQATDGLLGENDPEGIADFADFEFQHVCPPECYNNCSNIGEGMQLAGGTVPCSCFERGFPLP